MDSAGTEIQPGGTTSDTTVTLIGSALAGERDELFQNGLSKGHVSVNASSVWTLEVTALADGSHNFQARGDYGSGPVSGVRGIIVEATTAPTIDSIKDANGGEIPEGETTISTSVTLSGTAMTDKEVQIFDDQTLLGAVTATGANWTLPLSSLAVKAYSIKAKGLYGSNPESAVRRFEVVPGEDFETVQYGVIPVGGSGVLTTMTITALAGHVSFGRTLTPPHVVGMCVGMNGNATFRFNALLRKIRFGGALFPIDGRIRLEFYGEQQQLIRSFDYPGQGEQTWWEFDFSPNRAKELRVICVRGSENTSGPSVNLDNFTFTL